MVCVQLMCKQAILGLTEAHVRVEFGLHNGGPGSEVVTVVDQNTFFVCHLGDGDDDIVERANLVTGVESNTCQRRFCGCIGALFSRQVKDQVDCTVFDTGDPAHTEFRLGVTDPFLADPEFCHSMSLSA